MNALNSGGVTRGETALCIVLRVAREGSDSALNAALDSESVQGAVTAEAGLDGVGKGRIVGWRVASASGERKQ
jgi:hypothetical protein